MRAQQLAEVEEVRWVIRECLSALRSWDGATIARIFDPDEQAIHIGTAADEFYAGGAAYVQVMEQTHTQTIPDLEIEFLPEYPVIQTRTNCAWATGKALVSGTAPNGRYFEFPTRLTFVLEKNDEAWQIVHSHYSIGVATPS